MSSSSSSSSPARRSCFSLLLLAPRSCSSLLLLAPAPRSCSSLLPLAPATLQLLAPAPRSEAHRSWISPNLAPHTLPTGPRGSAEHPDLEELRVESFPSLLPRSSSSLLLLAPKRTVRGSAEHPDLKELRVESFPSLLPRSSSTVSLKQAPHNLPPRSCFSLLPRVDDEKLTCIPVAASVCLRHRSS